MKKHPLTVVVVFAVLGSMPASLAAQGETAIASALERETGVDALGDPLPEGCLMRLGTVRFHHSESIRCIAFSPDGASIATTAATNDAMNVCLWDARTGRLIRSLDDPDRKWGWAESIAFSPDGTKLALGRADGAVLLAEVGTGRIVFKSQRKKSVLAVAFAPGGTCFASGEDDGHVQLWNVADGKSLRDFDAGAKGLATMFYDGPSDSVVQALAFSPDGELLAAGTAKAAVHVWEVQSGQRVARIRNAHGQGLRSLAFTRDGRELISGGYRLVPQSEFGKPTAWSSVPVAETRFWDPRTGKPMRELKGEVPEAGYGAMALSADAKTLASGIHETIRLWDVPAGKSIGVVANPGWLLGGYGLALSPDGQIVASAWRHSAIALWDVATGKPILQDFIGHAYAVGFVACSPDGSHIISGGYDGLVIGWDAKTGMPKYERPLGRDSHVFSMAMSPDGTLVAAGGRIDWSKLGARNVIRVWRAQTGEAVRDFGGPDGPYQDAHCLRFSPDGKLLAIAAEMGRSNANEIDVWELAAGRKVAEIRPKQWYRVLDMAFSTDAKTLHAAWADKVDAWDVATASQLGSFVPHLAAQGAPPGKTRFQISHAVFSPDARRLFTSQEDAVVVWDVAAGKAISTLRLAGTNKGRYLGLSPDGRLLATAEVPYSGDIGTGAIEICAVARDTGSIRLWSHDAGRAAQAAAAGDGQVRAFAFSADNRRLITGMDRGTVLVWDLETANVR